MLSNSSSSTCGTRRVGARHRATVKLNSGCPRNPTILPPRDFVNPPGQIVPAEKDIQALPRLGDALRCKPLDWETLHHPSHAPPSLHSVTPCILRDVFGA